MSPSRYRFVWPGLCGLLVIALVTSTAHWKKQVRSASAKAESQKKPANQPPFEKRDAAFFRELASMRSYPAKSPLTGRDVAQLAAYDRIELNKLAALGRETASRTLASRDPSLTEVAAIPLGAEMRLSLSTAPVLYRYELTNIADGPRTAPILFQKDRWDSSAAIVEAAGFKSITDETERAVAIWRYLCPRRVFGDPPTEGAEEHDVVKFLSCYGYGYCDDSARALATLAELSGLKGRVWELNGHVVAEVMAGGKWRMLDADQQAYFARADAPTDILGVEELAADKANFQHLVSFRGAKEYLPKYRDCFLSKGDNHVSEGGTSDYSLETTLRSGEKIAFTNFNWGRYFLGKFPIPPPRYYNGTFTFSPQARDFINASKDVVAETMESGVRLRNTGEKFGSITLPFSYPFPIVGGMISGQPRLIGSAAHLGVEDADHNRSMAIEIRDRIHVDLDSFVAVLTPHPTHQFSITFTLSPGATLEIADFTARSDFQFAQGALLPLAAGENVFHAHWPEKTKPEDFKLTVSTRP